MNKNSRILIACEESGVVTKAFRDLSFDNVWSCDTQPTSGIFPQFHLQQDVMDLLKEKWDMIIAFPPCTYLSNAGACRLYPQKGVINQERYEKGLRAKEFFMEFLNADCDRICVENPVSSSIFKMPLHTQEIHPFMFGHPYTKRTRLWLKGLPRLQSTEVVIPIGPFVPSGTGRRDVKKYGAAKRGDDSKNRSKTFLGIAKAMASQWGKV